MATSKTEATVSRSEKLRRGGPGSGQSAAGPTAQRQRRVCLLCRKKKNVARLLLQRHQHFYGSVLVGGGHAELRLRLDVSTLETEGSEEEGPSGCPTTRRKSAASAKARALAKLPVQLRQTSPLGAEPCLRPGAVGQRRTQKNMRKACPHCSRSCGALRRANALQPKRKASRVPHLRRRNLHPHAKNQLCGARRMSAHRLLCFLPVERQATSARRREKSHLARSDGKVGTVSSKSGQPVQKVQADVAKVHSRAALHFVLQRRL